LTAEAREADAADFELQESFDLVLAPMQLIQLLDGAEARKACLASAAGRLRPGGLLALAVVEGSPVAPGEESVPPLPDVREVDGWVYSSLPLETVASGDSIVVRRLRQVVSPEGDLSEEVDEIELRALAAEQVEAEAVDAGLRPAGRRKIPATDAHVGSTVVLLEREES
jgi:SAM-dependent methyltransferase